MGAERLSTAQEHHLAELRLLHARTGYAAWQPETPGEWSVARALERKGYLVRQPQRGYRAYELRDSAPFCPVNDDQKGNDG